MKRKLTMMLMCMMMAVTALAQSAISGTVISAQDGEPVIGAAVKVKGASQGVVTNIDGKFTINVEAGKTLVVSYVGMQTKEATAKNGMTVTLAADDKLLDEVVVTALGISREKKSLGYAVQDVKSDKLTQASQQNVANALQGKVSGVQITQAGGAVGASQRIIIRGNSSFNSNDPLIVIDGVPMDGGSSNSKTYGSDENGILDTGSGLSDINPEDIENISILKGGSAALYGMRAGNGVILITTKKGKSNNGKLKINYDGSITFDQVYNLPKLQNKYGQGYGGSEYDYNYGGYYENNEFVPFKSVYSSYAEFAENEGYYFVDGAGSGVNDGDDESWGPRLDIGLKLPQYNSPVDANGNRIATPWVSNSSNIEDFFETGVSHSHNLAISNSSDKGNYRFALGYRNQEGVVPNTDQTRYNVALSGSYNFNKYISVDANLQYNRTHSDNLMATGYSSSNPLQSIMQWFGRQVDMKDLKDKWDTKDVDGNYYNWINAFHVNPYFNLYNNTNEYGRDRLIGKGSLWVKPTDWLKFEGRAGYDYYNSDTFQKCLYSSDCPNGWFNEVVDSRRELNLDFIAYFDKTFGDININALAGANYRDMTWKMNSMGANKSYGLTVPGLYTMGNVIGTPKTDMDHSHIRSNSVYANASLGWKNQVYLEASARNDWSSTIKDSFFYPSVSLSWVPTETFAELKSDAMSYLKIRANLANIGNATTAYRTNYYMESVGTTINNAAQYWRGNTLRNPDLKPEAISTQEIGLEAALWKNRIRLDLAYYHKETTDQIMTVQMPSSTGYYYKLINAGKVTNSGVELSLSADIFKNEKGFSWTSTLNWSKDKSKIKELTDGVDTYTIHTDWSVYNYAKVGESWGSLYGVGFAYDKEGRVVINKNGLPVLTADSKKIGDVTPDWLAGWSNEFTYKDFSFGFLLDYRKGGDFFSVTQMFGSQTGILDFTAAGDVRENGLIIGQDVLTDKVCVKEDGTPNDIRINAYNWFSSYYDNKELDVCDGSYLKLREMHLTYALPKAFLRSTKVISDAKVSFIASNLAILWLSSKNQSKIDPESTIGADNASVGFESNSCPPTRSYGVKLSLTF